MDFLERHKANENDYRPINDLLNFGKKYFFNRQNEGINYIIYDFGIERVLGNYIDGFYIACYLAENEWASKVQSGVKVEVEIGPVFSGNNKRPTEFEVKYYYNDILQDADNNPNFVPKVYND